MNPLTLILLFAGVFFHAVLCKTIAAGTRSTGIKLQNETGQHNWENSREKNWNNILSSEQNPPRLDDLKKFADVQTDVSKRKSKILGSLAFLAGLGIGGLAGAATSSMKTFAKSPQESLALSLGSSRLTPYFAAFYDPYAYVPQPYFYNQLGFYPLPDPARLQVAGMTAVQSALQTVSQNQLPQQVLNIFDNKGAGEPSGNGVEHAGEEKTAEDKDSVEAAEEAEDRAELRADADRNAEEKIVIRAVTCGTVKRPSKKQANILKSPIKEREDLQQDADDSLTVSLRVKNVTKPPVTQPPRQTRPPRPAQNTTQMPVTSTVPPRNNTETNNGTDRTTYPPFFGYYGGSPQEIDHIGFTTQTSFRYDYPPINYNLPYDRPANFYPEETYNYYVNPALNSYPNQFSQDHPPEYVNSDYSRLPYAPNNPPPFANGFRPIL